jgi:hypothetical protein
MKIVRLAALGAALLPLSGAAQERPSEADLFGGPPAAAPATTAAPATPPSPSSDARGDELLGADRAAPEARIDERKDNPLTIGGLAYLRATATWEQDVAPSRWPLASPNLLDVFLDARPNDRVRAFVLGRLTYDPTLAAITYDLLAQPHPQSQTTVALDQLYLNFDLGRTVFVTAGRQHAKWGTGKFWNPGDFLHPVKRDPLAQYDTRTGVTMVKAHVPWEAHGWNFYGVALLEDLAGASDGTSTVGRVGGAARAEVVLGPAELAASAAAQRGHNPRFSFDGSVAVLDVDLHGELVLSNGRDAPHWVGTAPDAVGAVRIGDQGWTRTEWNRITPQAVVGAEWSWKYSDEDSLILGGEFFWNDAGYSTARAYEVLLGSPYTPVSGLNTDLRVAFTPFYLGQRYLGAYLSLPKPGRWNDTTFTLSAIANLSDGTVVTRLDHSVVLDTYLTLETFVAGHIGHQGGEFRFGGTLQPTSLGGLTTPEITVPVPTLDLGVALRVKL